MNGPPGRPARPRPASLRARPGGRDAAASPVSEPVSEPEPDIEIEIEIESEVPERAVPTQAVPTQAVPTSTEPTPWVPARPATAPTTRVPRVAPGTGRTPAVRSGVTPPPPPRPTSVTGEVPAPFAGPRRAPVVTTGVADRLAERESMRRHRRRTRSLALVSAVVVLAGLAWVGLFSPALAARSDDVVVVGAGQLVDADAVHRVVDTAVGVPLPRLDTVALRERLLTVRGVADVAVARRWPHGLRVTITPRDPVAAVPTDGRFALLDAQGVQIALVGTVPGRVPVVTVPVGGPGHRELDAVLVVLAGLPESIAKDVTAVSASTQDAVRLTLRGGDTVVWGSASDTPLKARVLVALRKAPQTRDASVFDVSAPMLPVTR